MQRGASQGLPAALCAVLGGPGVFPRGVVRTRWGNRRACPRRLTRDITRLLTGRPIGPEQVHRARVAEWPGGTSRREA